MIEIARSDDQHQSALLADGVANDLQCPARASSLAIRRDDVVAGLDHAIRVPRVPAWDQSVLLDIPHLQQRVGLRPMQKRLHAELLRKHLVLGMLVELDRKVSLMYWRIHPKALAVIRLASRCLLEDNHGRLITSPGG